MQKHQHMYYRTEAGYAWGAGMSEEKENAFDVEATKFLEAIGFTMEKKTMSGSAPSGNKGNESLYFHPMSLSGWVTEATDQKIREAFRKGDWKTFKLRVWDRGGKIHECIDAYDIGYDHTPEELTEAFKAVEKEVQQRILKMLTTKRSNLYRRFDGMTRIEFANGVNRELIHTINSSVGAYPPDSTNNGRIITLCEEQFEKLLEAGKIVASENRGTPIYRTAKFAQVKAIAGVQA